MKVKIKSLYPEKTKTYDKVFMWAAFLFAYFFMSHPDLWETANHSYVFLEALFSGKFLDFYSFCSSHQNSYYYINMANYNIVIYIIFGLWELPVFLFNKIFSLPLNEVFLIYWAKLVSCAFYIGCGYNLKKLCQKIGIDDNNSSLVALFFLFNPVAFYSPVVMGQYDSLCLFFVLWSLCYYVDGDMTKFSAVIGVGTVCKFFPMLILVPLVLLNEKKILSVIKYLLISMWLYIPTTLLFWGRTGNASAFTKRMMERMFAIKTDTPFAQMSIFIFLYSCLLFFCFIYCPKDKTLKYMALYLPMTVFSRLMAFILWHPQWVVLMIPFMVATTFCQKNKGVWFVLDIVQALGFFMICYRMFGYQRGAYLFEGGILRHIMGIGVSGLQSWQPILTFMSLVPYWNIVMPVAFIAPIVLNIVLKMPTGESSLCDRLTKAEKYDSIPLKLYGYGIFIAGFVCMWLAPSLLELVNALGII